ncbi:hypothetical protein [Fulvivirga lutimaris]|uniref:hypothetical protein n=1 Tax=Fulvivirga lutimaris TaxID=1819566 RepID=UPI0012BCAA11|nr:hypothetical protein [Fulvivirga lutimaris]MTI38887.1 hypothetical protein [Fulvivirga lutimaris]
MNFKKLKTNHINVLEFLIIVSLALFPIFFTYPYRINIFLTWEGAYRLYQGQVPFKDFGLPMGYAFWLIPAMFFKIFGPYLGTLVKSQVLYNLLAGFSFRSILNSLGLEPGLRFLGVFLFVISYSFFNFWPWYNHSVIVFEIVSIAFLLHGITKNGWKHHLSLFLAALFAFLSFFTKQDGGAFAVLITGILSLYYSVATKSIKAVGFYVLYLIIVSALFIGPILPYEFNYWFNYGQAPHYSRFSLSDIINEVMQKSLFLKLYLAIILFILIAKIKSWQYFLDEKKATLFIILTLAILGQAMVLQVTSYTPPDGNIYFHSFAFIFIVYFIKDQLDFSRIRILLPFVLIIFFWWSGVYWKYANRIIDRVFPKLEASKEDAREVISINTYKLEEDTTALDKSTWVLSPFKAFDKVYMPKETIAGIQRLLELESVENGSPKVLNMSELTPLAHTLGYELEVGQPLWYHLNVAMFDRELNFFRKRIESDYYDLVLFEIIPNLNNFYPYELQDALKQHYKKIDVFQAPRRNTLEVIEVYVRKE